MFDMVLTVHRRYYVEIKCQLDATDEFLLQILLLGSTFFGHHYAHHQELEIIIQVVAACRIWCCKDGNCNFLGLQMLYNTLEFLMMGIMVPEAC
jgi:hypothetical protein